MHIGCWVHSWGEAPEQDQDALTVALTDALARQGVKAEPFHGDTPVRLGVCVFSKKTPELNGFVQNASQAGQERVIAIAGPRACRLTASAAHRFGRSRHWVKSKNPKHPAVAREAEEDWGKRNGDK